MGSKNGYYEYLYDFSAGEENDIHAKYKSNHLTPRLKAPFVFVIKTDFIVKGEPTHPDLKLDSETFITHIYPQGNDEKKNRFLIFRSTRYRLLEYWMSNQEIRLFAANALAFATHTSNDPKYAASGLVPILVRLRVCTVQQAGETFDAARQRAITESKLVPLFLWDEPAVEDPPGKQIPRKFKTFLMLLPRIRVEDAAAAAAGQVMGFCLVCKQKPVLGDQISTLSHCNHAFHSHCIVRELVEDIACPHCATPAYPYRRPRVPSDCVSYLPLHLEASQCPSVTFSNLISSSSKSSDSTEACEMGPGLKYLMIDMKLDCINAIRCIQAVAIPQSAQIAQVDQEINNTSSLDGKISLISCEGEMFKVDKAVALKSEVLKVIITKSSSTCIPLPAISSNILSKVIEFMNDDATVTAAKVDVKEFESKFLKDFDLRMLCSLLKGASFLCIPFLPELTSAVIADKLSRATESEIYTDFMLQFMR